MGYFRDGVLEKEWGKELGGNKVNGRGRTIS